MPVDERIKQAELLYERAVFGGEPDGLVAAGRGLDAVGAELAPARRRVIHARSGTATSPRCPRSGSPVASPVRWTTG
ncbi:hypothetical protein ACIO3O_14225 [Streptomyces sp. NPDC087440]|uniref:hypothetical protein n=1 Tax=Streptomyces sp. NPDC087440 TaxID=3365790 RepID=UPI00380F570E